MSDNNVTNYSKASFQLRLKKHISDNKVSDADFADIIYTACTTHAIDETQFRDSFGLSQGAVDRWTQLKNLPQPSARTVILTWILERVATAT